MSSSRPTDDVSNQAVLAITGLSMVGSGILFDWSCYGFAIALALIAFFGIIIMFDRRDRNLFG